MSNLGNAIQTATSRAKLGEGVEERDLSAFTSVRTRDVNLETINKGEIIDISEVKSLIEQSIPGSRGKARYAFVPCGTEIKNGKLVETKVTQWYPTSTTKSVRRAEKNSDGTITVKETVKSSGEPTDVYLGSINMCESIKALQAKGKYIKCVDKINVTALTFDRKDVEDNFVYKWEFVGLEQLTLENYMRVTV